MHVGKCYCDTPPPPQMANAPGVKCLQAECSKQFRDGGSFQQLIEAGFGCEHDEN